MPQFNSETTPLGPPKALEGGADERRLFAALAYIVPLLGGLIGLLVDGRNPLTRNHARQSIATIIMLILSFIVWAVAGYLIALIPAIGPIFSIALFTLVIAMALFLLANWIVNLVVALRGLERTIPFANRLALRLFSGDEASKPSA